MYFSTLEKHECRAIYSITEEETAEVSAESEQLPSISNHPLKNAVICSLGQQDTKCSKFLLRSCGMTVKRVGFKW